MTRGEEEGMACAEDRVVCRVLGVGGIIAVQLRAVLLVRELV